MSNSNNLALFCPSPIKAFFLSITATVMLGCSSVQQPRVSLSGIPVTSNHVCVDVNESLPSGDLLRAIEISLNEEGVSDTLYSRGTERTECKTTLEYSVHSQYVGISTAIESTEYWDSIDFTVLQGQIVIAVGRFEANGLNVRAVPFEDVESMVHALIRPVPAVISSRSERSEGKPGKSAAEIGERNASAFG
ncbi:hypothetical protein [Paraburkholderia bannensis]|uniref:hypothetical protein n=1 Tax=Paraburkholderia bannensis TaxID=765414 RepID=UPI002AB6A22A|nr:hypothetical protein [Paraburkholderia bannensis]